MAELWDIARHVEENPDDHEERWRLAKKLYMAWEYRLALEHLQVLRKDWEPRINVVRYLGATYYRLGRYDEAIDALRPGVEIWPEEIGLREQLARVLEVSGKRIEAADEWDAIAKLDPEHAIARSAARRLREAPEESPRAELNLQISDSGIDLNPGQVCRGCGAQNSADAAQCWQCQTPLFSFRTGGRPTPRPKKAAAAAPRVTPETIALLGSLAFVALLSLGVYYTVKHLLLAPPDALPTLANLYRTGLGIPRLIAGAVLFAMWPAALWFSMNYLVDRFSTPPAFINLTGLCAAALLFAASWQSPELLFGCIALTAIASLVAILTGFGLPPAKAFAVWGLHLLIVGVAGILAVLLGIRYGTGLWLNPVSEYAAARAFAAQEVYRGVTELPHDAAPVVQPIRWPSSGSAFVDAAGGQAFVSVENPSASAQLKFELQDPGGTRYFEFISGRAYNVTLHIVPDTPYKIRVEGDPGVAVQVRIESLLRPALD